MGTAVAKRTATAVKLKPIADVVRQIKTHIYDANNAEVRCVKHRLQAGQLLLQLRERIESGEAGNGINWWEWCEQHVERSRKDCEKLMRIASADDPEAALVEDREKTRLAVAKHRETKKADGVYVNSRAKLVTKPEQFQEDNARAWKADWLRCHPGRTSEEYEQILHSEQPGGDGPMWTWRRAFNRAAQEAGRAAWLRDHPSNPLPEHMCSLSEDETAEYEKWLETYEPPLISVPMPEAKPPCCGPLKGELRAVEPDDDEDSDFDAIEPEHYRTAFFIRTDQAAQMAHECAKLVRGLEASMKRVRGRDKMIDAATTAARAWTELSRALVEKRDPTLPQDGR